MEIKIISSDFQVEGEALLILNPAEYELFKKDFETVDKIRNLIDTANED